MADDAAKTVPVTSGIPVPSTNGTRLHLIRGSDIANVPQEWLIPDIVPDQELTGVLGDLGVGKTTFVMGLLAWFSKQYPVLMLSNEDKSTHIRRTFARLGGNLDNLYIEDTTTDDLPWLLDNCAALEAALKEHKPRIVGIDSYYSHAPAKKNTFKHDEVAPPLLALRRLANKYCPHLLIHHDNKSLTDNPISKSSGSQGIVGTIRHNVRVHLHPTDPNTRIVAVFKTNIGEANPPSLQFKIYPFEWIIERSDLSAHDLLHVNTGEELKKQRKKVDIAMEFIKAQMANGDRPAKPLIDHLMTQYSISEDTTNRARRLLGIYTYKTANGTNVWSYTYR